MKASTAIRSRQTREILRAGRHAWRIERDLNHFIVINFSTPDGDEFRPQRLFREVRRKFQSWLYYKRRQRFTDPLTDVRVWENVDGLLHVNWAVHVPEWLRAEFLEKLPLWISKALGGLSEGGYSVQDIYHLNGLLRYMLKGTEKGEAFGIRNSPQGEVWGRRAVAATCLGKAARGRDQSSGLAVRVSRRKSDRKQKTPADAGVLSGRI